MTGQTTLHAPQPSARTTQRVLSSKTRRIVAVGALALLLAVPSGYAVERAVSPATSGSSVHISQPAAPAGVPRWKFVEQNQMPEAPAVAPAAPDPASSRFQEINQMPEATQPIVQPSGRR